MPGRASESTLSQLIKELQMEDRTQQMTPMEVALRALFFGENIANPDGSVSTQRTVTEGPPGDFMNVPSIVRGRQLPPDQAMQVARGSGRQFPRFDTPQAGEEAAKRRSMGIQQAIEAIMRSGLLSQ